MLDAALAIESQYLHWRGEFAKAMDPRFYDLAYLDDVFVSGLLDGTVRLFANKAAAIMAEIKTYPTGTKDVCGIVAAGDLEAIVALIAQAEDWGRSRGCAGGVIESREGWVKVMKRYGYEPHQVAVRKVF